MNSWLNVISTDSLKSLSYFAMSLNVLINEHYFYIRIERFKMDTLLGIKYRNIVFIRKYIVNNSEDDSYVSVNGLLVPTKTILFGICVMFGLYGVFGFFYTINAWYTEYKIEADIREAQEASIIRENLIIAKQKKYGINDEIDQQARKIWEETLKRLDIMGAKVIFEPDLLTWMSYWGARGERAIELYAIERSMVGASREKMFSVVASDFHTYLLPIQECLKKHEYYSGKVDGEFRKQMVSAVKSSITKGESQGLPYNVHNMGLPNPTYVKFLKAKHQDCTLY